MSRALTDGGVEIVYGLIWSLCRQAEHEIDIEIIKSSLVSRPTGPVCLIGAVNPPEQRKMLIVKTLNPNREPVHTGIPVSGKPPGLCRPGIGLERDFGLVGKAFGARQALKQGLDAIRWEKAGCATPEKHSVKDPSVGKRQGVMKIAEKRLRVFLRW